MPLIIADDVLREAHLSESDARVEIAARLFQSGRLSFESAARLAGTDATGFNAALASRGIETGVAPRSPADEQYEAGYRQVPEDPTVSEALLPHLPLPEESWE